MTANAIIEAAALALEEAFDGISWGRSYEQVQENYRVLAKATLAAVAPLLRAQVLEEAAQLAEEQAEWGPKIGAVQPATCVSIAAAIRAMKKQP